MSFNVYPAQVRADASALVFYQGTPMRSLVWRIVAGDGTLTPISSYTDANGNAAAKYTPGTANTTVTIEVECGA
jgi:hypothetical protein